MPVLDFTVVGRDLSASTMDKLGLGFDKIIAKANQLDGKTVNIGVEVDDKGAITKLSATSRALDDIGKAAQANGNRFKGALEVVQRATTTLHDGLDILDRVRDRHSKLGDAIGATKNQLFGLGTASRNFGILAATASAGAIATAGALGVIPLAIAGVGIAFAATNEHVKASFTGLKDHVLTGMKTLTAPMVQPVINAIGQIGAAFDRLAPQIGVAMKVASGYIQPLTTGLVNFAQNAMPGIVNSLARSQPIVQALSAGLGNLGGAFSGFLQELSRASSGAASALTSVFSLINNLLPLLGTLFAALTNAGAPLLQVLIPALNNLLNVVGGALVNAFNTLGPVFARVAVAITPLLDAVGQLVAGSLLPALVQMMVALADIGIQLAPVFVSVIQSISPLIPMIVNLLTPVTALVPAVAQFVAALVTGLVPILQQILPVVTEIVTVLFQFAATILGAVLTAIQPLLPALGQFAQILANGILTIVQQLAPVLVTFVQQGLNAIVTALGPLLPALANLAVTLGTSLMQILIALMPAITAIVQAIVALLPAITILLAPLSQLVVALTPIIVLVATIASFILQLLVPAIAFLLTWIARILGAIISFFAEVIGGLVNFIKGFLDNWQQWLGNAVLFVVNMANAVTGFFGRLWADVTGWVARLWGDVTGWFGRLWADVTGWVSRLWADITGWFGRLWADVTGWVGRLWGDVTGWFGRLWADVTGWVGRLWGDVTGWFGRLWGDVTGWVGRLWGDVTGWFGRLWGDVTGTVARLWGDVTGWFGRLWGDISGWANRIWNTTVDIFNRMKDGLIATFRDIANFAFVDPINWVINVVVNDGIGGIVRNVGKLIGQNWDVHVGGLSRFAAGGVVPGYAPGKDSVPAMLSPGEGILVPEAVAMLGGPDAVHAINARSASRVPGNPGAGKMAPEAQHMALGGIIKDIWGGIKGAAGSVWDSIKDVGTWVREKLGDAAQFILDHTIYPIVDKAATPGLIGGVPRDLTHMVGQGLVNWLKVQDDKDRQAREASERTAAEQRGFRGPTTVGPIQGSNVDIVRTIAASWGWTGPEWDALYRLIMKESGFRNTAQNPTSTAYGMFQFLDNTWSGYGYAKTSDPTQQTLAGLSYISSKYGSPSGALSFHLAHNWYDEGGFLPTGTSLATNKTGKPEMVLPSGLSDTLVQIHQGITGATPTNVNRDLPNAFKVLQSSVARTTASVNTAIPALTGVASTANTKVQPSLNALMTTMTTKTNPALNAVANTANLNTMPALFGVANTANFVLAPAMTNLVAHANSAALSLNGGLSEHADSASASLTGTTGASDAMAGTINGAVIPSLDRFASVLAEDGSRVSASFYNSGPSAAAREIYAKWQSTNANTPWEQALYEDFSFRGSSANADKYANMLAEKAGYNPANLPNFFAAGGPIFGPGSGVSDSIPALLSNGEFVVNAAATKRWRPLLEMINAKKFATGGAVGVLTSALTGSPISGGSRGAAPAAGAGANLNPAILKAVDTAVKQLDGSIKTLGPSTDKLGVSFVGLNTTLLGSNKQLRNDETFTTLHNTAQWELTARAVDDSVKHQQEKIEGLKFSNHLLRIDEMFTANWTRDRVNDQARAMDISVNNQHKAMDSLKFGLHLTRMAFSETAQWAFIEFGRTYWAAANPIRDVINRPIRGLVDAWNSLDAQFAFGRRVVAPVAAFASGGFVSGPGGATEDKIPARLSNGEFVINAKITRKTKPFLEALNKGQAEAMQATGYATGGLVADTGSALNAKILKGQMFARAQHGKPYIWGGVGPVGYDCSGFQSAITNVLRDQFPHRRLFSTASFGRGAIGGFVPGLTSGYAIGVKQGSPGHMAGTLGGVNAEAGGSPSLTKFGAGAAGADHPQFPAKFSLPFVGGQFVPGGGGSGIDVMGVINDAFKAVPGLSQAILNTWPGNIAALHGVGVSRESEGRIRKIAIDKLTAIAGTIGGGGGGDVQAAVRAVAARYGWSGGPQWDALSWIIQKESGWNPAARNPTSSAAGLFQKMTSVHGPLEPTVAGQAEWGLNYIRSRYGSPIGARSFHLSHGYYANGGFIDQPTLALMGERGKELVLPLSRPRRTENLLDQAGLGGQSKTSKIEIEFKGNSDTAVATMIMSLIRSGKIQIKESSIKKDK